MKHLLSVFEGDNRPGQYVATILLSVVGLMLLGGLPLLVAMLANGVISEEGLVETFSTNSYLLLMFSSFAIALPVLWLCIRVFHHRNFRSVVNGGRPLRWGHFFTAFGLYTIVVALFQFLLVRLDPGNYVWQFDARAFFSMLPVLLVCVPVQTLFEEYLFRGYLMQATAFWTRRVWTALLLPALLFGLAHSANPEVGAYGFCIMMVQYILFGLIFGWFTLADDGIEVSWGMHTANNLFLLLFFTADHSALQTPAVWKQLDATPTWKDPLEMLLVGLLLWFVLKRIYHWKCPALITKLNENNQ